MNLRYALDLVAACLVLHNLCIFHGESFDMEWVREAKAELAGHSGRAVEDLRAGATSMMELMATRDVEIEEAMERAQGSNEGGSNDLGVGSERRDSIAKAMYKEQARMNVQEIFGNEALEEVDSSSSSSKSFCNKLVQGIPSLSPKLSARSLRIEASGVKKISTKTPLGPSGDTKFKGNLDASGRKAKGKGVYQYTKKYGANVDGYSPIYVPEEWSTSGDSYAAGPTGLAIWAVTLGAILLGGALLVYNTSALAQ
ncbi:hypothetical protein GOP47_0017749 [Adiantum capillus-veneris]|uniref:Photosystem II 10 kDa polypeptide, chloroplastic n=1 Tax=Adiantum capillus-veneris TaxID=13818 RepID=A0A9D4UFZ6_ADICA|nr:hypothetical protein GOP47_0017749 [Adiantum capillus-veneris]